MGPWAQSCLCDQILRAVGHRARVHQHVSPSDLFNFHRLTSRAPVLSASIRMKSLSSQHIRRRNVATPPSFMQSTTHDGSEEREGSGNHSAAVDVLPAVRARPAPQQQQLYPLAPPLMSLCTRCHCQRHQFSHRRNDSLLRPSITQPSSSVHFQLPGNSACPQPAISTTHADLTSMYSLPAI